MQVARSALGLTFWLARAAYTIHHQVQTRPRRADTPSDYLTTYNQTFPDARTEKRTREFDELEPRFFGEEPADTFGIQIDPKVTAGPNGVNNLCGPGCARRHYAGVRRLQRCGAVVLAGTSPYTVAGLCMGDSERPLP